MFVFFVGRRMTPCQVYIFTWYRTTFVLDALNIYLSPTYSILQKQQQKNTSTSMRNNYFFRSVIWSNLLLKNCGIFFHFNFVWQLNQTKAIHVQYQRQKRENEIKWKSSKKKSRIGRQIHILRLYAYLYPIWLPPPHSPAPFVRNMFY